MLFDISNAQQVQIGEMPACYSEWKALPNPIPPGSYALIFTARVAHPGMVLTVTTREGKFVATLTYPQTRNWECEKAFGEPEEG